MSENNNPMGLEQRDLLISLTTTIKSLEGKLDEMRRDQKDFEVRLEEKFVGKSDHVILTNRVDALSKTLKEDYVTKHEVEPMLAAYNYGASTLRKWIVISLLVIGVLGVGLWIGNQVMKGATELMNAQKQIVTELNKRESK